MDLVTFGETMVLLVADAGVPLADASGFSRSIAGCESNVAIAMARCGYTVGWFGRVGADPFGDVVVRTIRGEGVDTSRARVDGRAPTGLLVRDSHPGRPIEVLYFRSGSAGSRLSTADVDPAYLGAARILHVSGITPLLSPTAHDATLAAVEAARSAGVTVSFDPNVRRRLASPERAAEVLAPIAARADIVLTGDDEAHLLTGEPDLERAAARLAERGPSLVAVKLGKEGSFATDGQTFWRQPASPAHTVDPVGAGDAYCAGFLAATLDGLDVPGRLARAAELGALAVGVTGDFEGIPHRYVAGRAHVDVHR